MSELALELIEENKKTRATFLDLGKCGLTKIPYQLAELEWLEELNFADFWFDDEHHQTKNIGKRNNIIKLSGNFNFFKNINVFQYLKNLKKLWLNDNEQLTDITPLAILVNLQTLYIFNTQINDVSALANLVNLQTLHIDNTQINDVSALTSLINLQTLDISNTQVNDISALASLINLQTLDISDTQVNDISALASLINLKILYIHSTPINDITPLGNLCNLQTLDIYNTKIKDVDALASLVNLQELYIFRTQIDNISTLSSLINLQEFGVSHTQVNDITPLAGLINLQELDISHTQINDLSPLLEHIKRGLPVKLKNDYEGGIIVENCPLTNPPLSIVEQGNEAIINYFQETQKYGIDHLYEAKLLLVGEGGAGKTSLLRRLYKPQEALPQENETTKGIAIYQHEFNITDSRYPNGRVFRLNVWDFGGQEMYRPTDTFFFTQRSLYILLDDTRKDDKTIHDERFKYWLEAVELLSNHSPVLIFQNEKGGRSKTIDLAGIKGKFDNVKECYGGNLEFNNTADKIREAIEYFAKTLPHIGEELPAQWLKIRADIEKLAQQYPTISFTDYLKLYENYLPANREKALRLSRYLHDLGIFLHYQDDELLKRTVILQNQWATEAVFKILDDESVKKQLGRFTTNDCARVWQESVYADMHPELLALMQKFELCYLLPDTNPKQWLAPQLLPPSKPIEFNTWAKAGDLVLRYRYEFLPKGMINRLMVRQHRFVTQPQLAWLTGVLFERDDSQVLVEIPAKGGEIELRARGIQAKELLSVIANDLDALNESFKGLPEKVTQLIPCYCKVCAQQTQPESFEKKELLRRKKLGKETIECRASFDDMNVLQLLDGITVKQPPIWSQEVNLKRVFISYSKHDNDYKQMLLKHLTGLRNKIITWNDRDILAGEQWDKRIKEELNNADIVLYLVSANSMATDYIQQIELPLIEQRCNEGDCLLIPIIVDFCLWEQLDFAQYNALPEKGIPVTDTKHWVNENQAWLTVIKGIERLVC
ncbi:MAG: COR domain-containing protein [Methylococcaceae bacterium]